VSAAEFDAERFEAQAAMVVDLYEAAVISEDTAMDILADASGQPGWRCAIALGQEMKDRLWAAEWRPLKRGDDGTWMS
jgi:hypothetical protein